MGEAMCGGEMMEGRTVEDRALLAVLGTVAMALRIILKISEASSRKVGG